LHIAAAAPHPVIQPVAPAVQVVQARIAAHAIKQTTFSSQLKDLINKNKECKNETAHKDWYARQSFGNNPVNMG
jgi:hypothetical protein